MQCVEKISENIRCNGFSLLCRLDQIVGSVNIILMISRRDFTSTSTNSHDKESNLLLALDRWTHLAWTIRWGLIRHSIRASPSISACLDTPLKAPPFDFSDVSVNTHPK